MQVQVCKISRCFVSCRPDTKSDEAFGIPCPKPRPRGARCHDLSSKSALCCPAGQHHPAVPASKHLLTDNTSNILVGHCSASSGLVAELTGQLCHAQEGRRLADTERLRFVANCTRCSPSSLHSSQSRGRSGQPQPMAVLQLPAVQLGLVQPLAPCCAALRSTQQGIGQPQPVTALPARCCRLPSLGFTPVLCMPRCGLWDRVAASASHSPAHFVLQLCRSYGP